MLILSSTSDIVRIVTGSAVDVDVHASWVDFASGAVTPGRTNTKITTATTTTVVGSPASGTVRNVKYLAICNVHASSSTTVTVQHFDGSNSIGLESITLLAGERLSFVEGAGWRLVDSAGILKQNPLATVGAYFVQRLSATVSNSTTTAAKVTGLDFPTAAGTFVFEYFLRFQSGTAGTGFKLGCNYTGTVTTFDYTIQFPQTNTADSAGTMDQDVTAAAVVIAGLAARAKTTTAPLISTGGVDTTSSDILVQITGLMVVTVAGNLELYHASETAVSTSIMLDSALRITRIA